MTKMSDLPRNAQLLLKRLRERKVRAIARKLAKFDGQPRRTQADLESRAREVLKIAERSKTAFPTRPTRPRP